MSIDKRLKSVRERLKAEKFDEDGDGRAIVKINITDADSLLSVYNDDGQEIISSETATFINNVTKPIPARQDIHLQISCDEYTKEKEQVYKNAITNYYLNEFAHNDFILKKNLILSCILFVVATICFTILYLMSVFNAPEILYLLFDVVSWVFMWEAVDQFFLQRHFLKTKQYKELQIIFAKITFKALKSRDMK